VAREEADDSVARRAGQGRHRVSRGPAPPSRVSPTPEAPRPPASLRPRPPMSTPVRPYAGAQILLGITGGIASYKSGWLARLLTKAGAKVDVVMTPAATEFVGAVTFEG